MYIAEDTMRLLAKYIDDMLARRQTRLSIKRWDITKLLHSCHEGTRTYVRVYWELGDVERTEVDMTWNEYIREYLDPARCYALFPKN